MIDPKRLDRNYLPKEYRHLEPIFYSVKDTCEALNLGKTTVYMLLATNELARVKWRRRTLILRESVHEYAFRLMAKD